MSKGTNAHGPKKIWVPKSHIVPIADILGRKRPRKDLDNGFSWHMIGERSMFLDLNPIEGGTIAFGGMGKGKITDIGKIGIPSLASIDNV